MRTRSRKNGDGAAPIGSASPTMEVATAASMSTPAALVPSAPRPELSIAVGAVYTRSDEGEEDDPQANNMVQHRRTKRHRPTSASKTGSGQRAGAASQMKVVASAVSAASSSAVPVVTATATRVATATADSTDLKKTKKRKTKGKGLAKTKAPPAKWFIPAQKAAVAKVPSRKRGGVVGTGVTTVTAPFASIREMFPDTEWANFSAFKQASCIKQFETMFPKKMPRLQKRKQPQGMEGSPHRYDAEAWKNLSPLERKPLYI